MQRKVFGFPWLMALIILVTPFLYSANVHAQNATSYRVSGHFDSDTPDVRFDSTSMSMRQVNDPISIYYSISAANGFLSLDMYTSDAFDFDAQILDIHDNVVMSLNRQSAFDDYSNNISISSLSQGEYYFEFIFGNNGSRRHRVGFSKQ